MAARRIVIDLTDRRPTPTQWAFQQDSTTRIKALLGGLGSGKTSTGAEAFVDLVLANPGCLTMMVGPTHEMTEDLCVPAFEAACPSGLILDHHKKKKLYRLRGGRAVKYASADKPSSLEGRNLAAFWADEARYYPVQSWRNIIARLRDKRARRLQGVVTSTPENNWLEDEFDTGVAQRRVYRISTEENRGNLAPGYIEDLRRRYSKRLAAALIDGGFAVIEGQVYEEYDEARHVIDWQYDPRLPLWLSWDFGIRASSILFAQPIGDFGHTLREGRHLPPHSMIVFDELQIEEKPTIHQIPEVIRRLKAIGQRRAPGTGEWLKPHRIVCDPAGNQRSQDTGMQSVALLQEAFGRVVRWEDDMEQRLIPNRISRVLGALDPVEGDPTLYFARSLVSPEAGSVEARRGIIKAVRGSKFEEKNGRRKSDRPQVDEYEHARDTLEYLVIHGQNQLGRPVRTTRAVIAYGRR